MTASVTIDTAGGHLGGAARYRKELSRYLERRGRDDVKVIGTRRHLSAVWLAVREATAARHSRRVSLNNVGFLAPGGERWTLLTNALHFPSVSELAELDQRTRVTLACQASIVHRAARRSDVLIAPCTAMAERITAVLPDVADRVVVRMHPVSPDVTVSRPEGALILCPVLFSPYKRMADRIDEWLTAAEGLDESVRLIVTASEAEVPPALAANKRLHLAGRLTVEQTRALCSRSRAIYFPTGLESFGCALAEARVYGLPVIARDTPQNREIAGPALRGFTLGDRDSLRHATETALATTVAPDPKPFDPDAYFDWMLGAAGDKA